MNSIAPPRIPPTPPPSFTATAESLLATTRDLISSAQAVQDAVVSNITTATATFANVLLPLAQEENSRLYERQLIEFYASISTDEAVRDASEEAARLFAAFDSESAWRDDLYVLMAAVRDKGESLEPECHRMLEKYSLDSERNGLKLNAADRERLSEVEEALARMQQEYLARCRDTKVSLWFMREELDGTDPSFLDELESGTNANTGKLHLIVDGSRRVEILRFAHRQETRRKVFAAQATSSKDNVALLEEAVVLREEKARILGYSSWNHFRMADGMEKSPKQMEAFLEDLVEKVRPVTETFVAKWRRMKREDLKVRGEVDDGNFYEWDRQYYSAKLLAEEYEYRASAVAEFFALDETVDRMLSIFEEAFGMKFVELREDEREAMAVWHEDVRMFAVWDDSAQDGDGRESLGYLYMDMHPRKPHIVVNVLKRLN